MKNLVNIRAILFLMAIVLVLSSCGASKNGHGCPTNFSINIFDNVIDFKLIITEVFKLIS